MFNVEAAAQRKHFDTGAVGDVAWEGESIATHVERVWTAKTGRNYTALASLIRSHVGTDDNSLIDIETAQGRVAVLLGIISTIGHIWMTAKTADTPTVVQATAVVGILSTVLGSCVANSLALAHYPVTAWLSLALPFVNTWFTLTMMTRYWKKYLKRF